ncbi:MarR family winged helix-turn-helix transcriptional regulator [Luteipulveratus mongoliensis]|uniref:MarR family winged helix-turn-helix transcriptional regulator n=1 Tax=Luteipulveratus mongoliensis TaxID=571913 RepID=UPI000696773F|nr:MarR family transcriptional regulator [Luteipulveratus mongoliensis]
MARDDSRSDHTEEILSAWSRERPDVDVSSISIITPLWRLGRAVVLNRERTLAAFDLDHSGLDVLATLRRSGAPYRLTSTELSLRCEVTLGATTQRVARLEARGLIERIREEPDRRTVFVRLTMEGQELLDEVFGEVMRSDETMLDGLSDNDRATLSRLLRRWERAVVR